MVDVAHGAAPPAGGIGQPAERLADLVPGGRRPDVIGDDQAPGSISGRRGRATRFRGTPWSVKATPVVGSRSGHSSRVSA
ncbi:MULTISPECIES: hypothetical protein [Frankia]|nr:MULTISPECIES: hypothetical protein [Frankia]